MLAFHSECCQTIALKLTRSGASLATNQPLPPPRALGIAHLPAIVSVRSPAGLFDLLDPSDRYSERRTPRARGNAHCYWSIWHNLMRSAVSSPSGSLHITHLISCRPSEIKQNKTALCPVIMDEVSLSPPPAVIALRESFGDRKPPDITRKITACVACRKQKVVSSVFVLICPRLIIDKR